MDNEELLKKISDNSAKSLRFQRISAFCMIGIFVVVLVVAFMLVPPVINTVNEINDTAISVGETVTKASALIDEMDKTAKEIQDTSNNMDKLLTDNSETITEALDKMSKIDFDGLNEGIKDLQDAVGPFADFMNRFR